MDSFIWKSTVSNFLAIDILLLDSVAYIRFASVYKDFSEAKDFEDFAGSVVEAALK
jgi:transcriptional repressor NrdR